MITDLGAVDDVERRITELTERGLGALAASSVTPEAGARLRAMAVAATAARGMRTVAGQTDRIVVVGAGLSGLAAALHLTGAGRAVTLIERDDHPGGRVGFHRGPDYEIDYGATVLTLPGLVDEALAAVGADAAAHDLRIHARGSVVPGAVRRRHDHRRLRRPRRDGRRGPAYLRRRGSGPLPGTCAAGWRGSSPRPTSEFMDTNFDSPLDMRADPGQAGGTVGSGAARRVRPAGAARASHSA